MTDRIRETLEHFLVPDANVQWGDDGIAVAPIDAMTPGMDANARFFAHPKWGPTYFEYENFSDVLGDRWRAATGSWDGRIVVDVGCGPGNLFRVIGGSPRLLIGVDISRGALSHARDLGYTPLLADAHGIPLVSGFADIVTANATLHHCDDMEAVLSEAARLVRPGGVLVTDEDPLSTEARYRGLGLAVWRLRSLIPVIRVRRHPRRGWRFLSRRERRERWETEVHRSELGDEGVELPKVRAVLEQRGFDVKFFPHHHVADARVLDGDRGTSSLRARLTMRLSGMDPDATDAGLSVMCVARKKGEEVD